MLSEKHENIIDEVRAGFWKYQYLQDIRCEQIGAFFIECKVARFFIDGLDCNLPRADGYFLLFDGADPLVLEVGHMKDGVWNSTICEDGKPVRVIRVGIDYSLWILNERNTNEENLLIQCIKNQFRANTGL